ncbi:hypothetical protein TanjilG_14034 [Lupinus angustifolius]|uniref:Uncharacterized protein n=1 Tax=Lupinus angustifolius TaxID=3871 RepID=A0A1J7FM75_LUPAN|nr:hypothetical protein TanjilG_29995 [Lupinus angustifolius]OIV89896.1 hypothetical protein TanjilG_14034 [Lupinus angustifolius]
MKEHSTAQSKAAIDSTTYWKGIGRTDRPLGQDRLLARWSAISDLGFLTTLKGKTLT